MFKSKLPDVVYTTAPPAPSLEDRLLSAQLLSSDARSAFLTAAMDLEETANELDTLALDTQNQLDRLVDIVTACGSSYSVSTSPTGVPSASRTAMPTRSW